MALERIAGQFPLVLAQFDQALRELHARRSAEITVFSAHDADEYAALSGRSAG